MNLKESITRRVLFLAVSLVFFSLEACWRKFKTAFNMKTEGTCVVLCYHSVPKSFAGRFRNQIAILKRIAKSIPADFEGELENGIRHAIVTFDDGYCSVVENALPILEKYKVQATIFAIANRMGVYPDWISTLNHPDIKELTLSQKEISDIQKDFIGFGSHGLTHAKLTELDEHAAEREIVESKKILAKITNSRIRMLAFPYGYYDCQLVKIAREAGYLRVFTLEPALALCRGDEFCTGRFEICLDYWAIEFKLILLGAYRWLPKAKKIKSKIKSIILSFKLKMQETISPLTFNKN